MRRLLTLVISLALAGAGGSAASAAGWVFRASYYTHDPGTGERVTQYAPPAPSLVTVDPTYQRSMYRHDQTTIRVGPSADRQHVVETWGNGENIRPYGEWQRPFREGATPFGPWGNPQGPWTDPFGSWVNPYGLNRTPYLPGPWGYGTMPARPAPWPMGPGS